MSTALLGSQIEGLGWHVDGAESDVQAHSGSGQVKLGQWGSSNSQHVKY